MRHRKEKIHLGRSQSARKQLLKDLATSLFLHDEIETTITKAKILRPYAERLISSARNDSLAARRAAIVALSHKMAVKKLFEVIGPQYKNRLGGYTRIRRTSMREGDAAERAVISLV